MRVFFLLLNLRSFFSLQNRPPKSNPNRNFRLDTVWFVLVIRCGSVRKFFTKTELNRPMHTPTKNQNPSTNLPLVHPKLGNAIKDHNISNHPSSLLYPPIPNSKLLSFAHLCAVMYDEPKSQHTDNDLRFYGSNMFLK